MGWCSPFFPKKYIPTVPRRGAFYSAASGPADRRRIMSAAQLAASLKNYVVIGKVNSKSKGSHPRGGEIAKSRGSKLGGRQNKGGGDDFDFFYFFSEGANCAADIMRRRSAGPAL